MKNLTRILALVLVFTMMISTAVFAGTFTDVAEDSTYAEATTVLSALGILNGYEDGTFKPDAVITRAEVVAVANRLQGLSDAAKAAANATKYTDVPSTAWYAGDVNLATQMGVVAGDGNGLFRPDDQVKYEEAVKMMVAALGYHQEYVLKQGGWPTGYLVIATEKGVTKGLSVNAGEPAYRGIVAKLAYQSLTAPMMVLASYDDEGKATYRADETKTLLGTKLGFAKVSGHVVANEVSSLTSATDFTEKGYVDYKFDATKLVESTTTTQDGYKYYVGNRDVADHTSGKIKDIDANGFDLADTLGYATDIYLSTNDKDEPMVLTYVNKKNAVVTIEDPTMIQPTSGVDKPSVSDAVEIGEDSNGDPIYGYYLTTLSVYDEENETVEEEYNLDDARIIYNGKYAGKADEDAIDDDTATAIGAVLAPKNGKVELLDNDADGKYDYIFVTAYETMVVQEVYNKNTKIGMLTGSTLDLEKHIDGRDGYAYSITLDGKEIAITDLQEYDVISVAKDASGKNIDIIVSRNVVEGEIDAIEGTGDKRIFTIAGKEYKFASLANLGDIDAISTTSEGKFFIDYFGNLAWFDGATGLKGNVAFIQGGAEVDSTRGTGYEVEFLNKDGSVQVLKLADKVKVNGATSGTEAATVGAKITALLADDEDSLADRAKLVVTYKVNAANKVAAISFAGEVDELDYDAIEDTEYAESTLSFDEYGITENVVVFYVPYGGSFTIDDHKIATSELFADETEYDVAFFDVDDNNNAGLLLVTAGVPDANANAGLALATKVVETTNDNDEDVYQITFLQNGESKTLKTATDLVATIEVGSIFEYSVNADGDINKAKIAYSEYAPGSVLTDDVLSIDVIKDIALGNILVDDKNTPDPADDIYFALDVKKAGSKKVSYIGGYVAAKSGSTLTLVSSLDSTLDDGKYVIDLAGHAKVNVGTSCNVYTVSATTKKIANGKAIPTVAALGDITKAKISSTTGEIEENEDTFVLIKYVDKTVVDVIAFNGFNF